MSEGDTGTAGSGLPSGYRTMRWGGGIGLAATVVGALIGDRRLGHLLLGAAFLAFLLLTIPIVRGRRWLYFTVVALGLCAVVGSALS